MCLTAFHQKELLWCCPICVVPQERGRAQIFSYGGKYMILVWSTCSHGKVYKQLFAT